MTYLTEQIRIEGLSEQQQMVFTGINERNLDIIQEMLQIQLSYRDETLFVSSCDETTMEILKHTVHTLIQAISIGRNISEQDVIYAVRQSGKHQDIDYQAMASVEIGRASCRERV